MKLKPRFFLCISLLLCLSINVSLAQEKALKYRFTPGEILKYRIITNSVLEGSVIDRGKVEVSMLLYYTLTVKEMNKEGTATVTFKQDSVLYSEDKKETPFPSAQAMKGIPVTVQISNRGILLDWQYPPELQQETVGMFDQLFKLLATEPPLPGTTVEVGEIWKNDITFYFSLLGSIVKSVSSVTSKYVRQERFKGTPCARIEYSGILEGSKGQRGGTVHGTTYVAHGNGKKLRSTQEVEASIYFKSPQGAVQVRVHSNQTVEALN